MKREHLSAAYILDLRIRHSDVAIKGEILLQLLDEVEDSRKAAKNKSWRCFHCDEVFTDRQAAADHFGVQIDGLADEVACKINATDGQLVSMLREAQAELRQYHQEDNAAFRQFYALGADHSTALRREEEKGYARGLEDGRRMTADDELRN